MTSQVGRYIIGYHIGKAYYYVIINLVIGKWIILGLTASFYQKASSRSK